MQAVQWPDRKCRMTIFKGDIPYSCEVVDMHPGPCATFSDTETYEARTKWEQDNPDWKAQIKEAGGAFE